MNVKKITTDTIPGSSLSSSISLYVLMLTNLPQFLLVGMQLFLPLFLASTLFYIITRPKIDS